MSSRATTGDARGFLLSAAVALEPSASIFRSDAERSAVAAAYALMAMIRLTGTDAVDGSTEEFQKIVARMTSMERGKP